MRTEKSFGEAIKMIFDDREFWEVPPQKPSYPPSGKGHKSAAAVSHRFVAKTAVKGKKGASKGAGKRQAGAQKGAKSSACHQFNTKEGCNRHPCRFTHACSKCGGKHAAHECRAR